jgi:hemerythrin-like domain-containing protein
MGDNNGVNFLERVMQSGRREFLAMAAGLGLGGLGGATATLLAAPRSRILPRVRAESPEPSSKPAGNQSEEEPNTPPESLMLDHAVQERLLAVYEEIAERLQAREDQAAASVLSQAAALVRNFYENLHQPLEEGYVFPQFENDPRLGPLVKTLKAQHIAGRALTDKILAATGTSPLGGEARGALVRACRAMARLSRAHMAREATDLLQALYDIVPTATLQQWGEQFEQKQEATFGDNALKNLVAQVGGMEKELGLGDLGHFTP